MKLIAEGLNTIPQYGGCVRTMRTPDLLIEKHWALEIKLARPFGDNGKPAENWSVNLLHPYSGNTSLLGDCLKLQAITRPEERGVVAIGYEHDPAQVSLEPLWKAFEVVAADVLKIQLGARAESEPRRFDPSSSSMFSGRGLENPLRSRLGIGLAQILPRSLQNP